MNVNVSIDHLSLPGEEWKPIGDNSHMYLASSFGRIISCPYLTEGCVKGLTKVRLLSPHKSKSGFLDIYIGGKVYKVHYLIASLFLPNPDNYYFVEHVDGDKSNNAVSNLVWVESHSKKNALSILPNFSFAPTSLPGEKWKYIKGTHMAYSISSFGRVMSHKRGDRILAPKVTEDGYLRVVIHDSGRRKESLVHRLVAEEFLGHSDGMEVDHIDCIRTNNIVSNLRLVTHTENMNNPNTTIALKKRKGPMSGRLGKHHPCSKPIYAISASGERVDFEGLRDAERKGFAYGRVYYCLHHPSVAYKNLKWYFLN